MASQKDVIATEAVPGRYPFWNFFRCSSIVIDKNLDFASDMRVLVYNLSKTLILRRDKWELVGEFSVPIKSIKNYYDDP